MLRHARIRTTVTLSAVLALTGTLALPSAARRSRAGIRSTLLSSCSTDAKKALNIHKRTLLIIDMTLAE